jgi:hypothetical protein
VATPSLLAGEKGFNVHRTETFVARSHRPGRLFLSG